MFIGLNFKTKKGFTLIDALVGTFLIIIVFLGILGAYQLAVKVIFQNKARIIAIAIANQKIETIKNLPYKKIGNIPKLADGPEGELLQTETILQNYIEYTLSTEIRYVSDCFDGPRSAECPTAPLTDDCVKDYKRVKVVVSWSKPFQGEVTLITDISPNSLNQELEECTGSAAGVLSVSVFDALGQAISSPLIEILNPLNEEVLTSYQPVSGEHNFVFSPSAYKIRITNPGTGFSYSSETTYQTGDSYGGRIITEPVKSHPLIYESNLTEIGFSIDKLSNARIKTLGTLEQGYPIIGNVNFEMQGLKTVGKDENGDPIYKYLQSQTSNAQGEIELTDLEWDSYNFYVDSPSYQLIGIQSPPGVDSAQPFDILPDTFQEINLILKAENTLSVKTQDINTADPIFGASVRLFNFDLSYDETYPTDEEGQAFFIPLEKITYSIEVKIDGYETYNGTIFVSGDTTPVTNPNALIFLTPLPE
jgi:hypothetical protein